MGNDNRISKGPEKRLTKKPGIIRVILFVVAVLFIVFGWVLDEPFIVLNKAIFICLECIGVG